MTIRIFNRDMVWINGTFLAYLLNATFLHNDFLTAVCINLIMFVIPGYAWSRLFRELALDQVSLVFYVFAASAIFLGLAHGLILFFDLAVHPLLFVTFLWTVSVVGLITRPANTGKAAPWTGGGKRLWFWMMLGMVFVGLFVGMKTIPALPDHDGEHQGTSYGLIHDMTPYFTYDILPVVHYFSHPTLTSYWNAASILFFGDLERYRHYYVTAHHVENILDLPKDGVV
ncbi:MAG: hypothetical protein K8I00_07490, partial [Candidatus Omnitrophica bacterium]|nr:hypothetical protein [Candidatus Omnitrophota bacterium]